MLEFAGRFTVSVKFAELLSAGSQPVAPPEVAVHAHAHELNCTGMLSVTSEPGASDGPTLLTTIVYTSWPPIGYVVTPSSLVTPRSAIGCTLSVSLLLQTGFTKLRVMVASLTQLVPRRLVPAGGCTLAVLVTVPVLAVIDALT